MSPNAQHIASLVANITGPTLYPQIVNGADTGDELSIHLINAMDKLNAFTCPATAGELLDAWQEWDARHRLARGDREIEAVIEFTHAAEWFQQRNDCLRSAAKYHGDCGAQALVAANELATDHLLHRRGSCLDQPVRDFVGLVAAAQMSDYHA